MRRGAYIASATFTYIASATFYLTISVQLSVQLSPGEPELGAIDPVRDRRNSKTVHWSFNTFAACYTEAERSAVDTMQSTIAASSSARLATRLACSKHTNLVAYSGFHRHHAVGTQGLPSASTFHQAVQRRMSAAGKNACHARVKVAAIELGLAVGAEGRPPAAPACAPMVNNL